MATLEITKDNLETTVSSDGIVILDFWASWCAPCRMFAPIFEEASVEHSDIVFGKVDTEAEHELAAAFRITSIPTLMAFRDGILLFAQPGAIGAASFDELIGELRKVNMDEVRSEIAKQDAGQADDQ